MKANSRNTWTGKAGSALIVAMVIAGTAFFPAVANLGEESSVLTTLFFAFLGGIVAIQVIPGIILFCMMVKGIFSLVRSRSAEPEPEKAE